jgi:hypothetical protein
MVTSKPAFPIIFDEFATYFADGDTYLKEQLRNIVGIPNATYQVIDGKVFIFDKLVKLVKKQQALEPSLPLSELAYSSLLEATVTANEAVTDWNIIPVPYELAPYSLNGFMIRHKPFNAMLPIVFKTEKDAQEVLAKLILESVPFDNGEFNYRGQALSLCEPLNLSDLPSRPDIQIDYPSEVHYFSSFNGLNYEVGFDPVPEALFNEIKALETSWKLDLESVEQYVQEHAADVWALTHMLNLEALDDPTDQVPDYQQDEFSALRILYPEFPMLSAGSLFAWFDKYQSDCCYTNGWTANRDDGFLLYLIGKIAGLQYEQNVAIDVGKWVSYSLLRGESLYAALQFGNEAFLYNTSILKLAYSITDAIRFVADDKKKIQRQGPSISTMSDLFASCRSISVKQDLVKLDISG